MARSGSACRLGTAPAYGGPARWLRRGEGLEGSHHFGGDFYAVFGGDAATAPHLVHEGNGTVAIVPWMNHSEDELTTGVVYHLILWNTDGAFSSGDRATLVVGDVVLKHIPVQ